MSAPGDANPRGVARLDLLGGWYFQTEASALMSLRNPHGAGMGLWSRKAAEDFAAAIPAGAIDRLETALKSMTRQMWEQSSRADEADRRRVAAEAGRAMMIDVQEHRNEACQTGWSDGYAEGHGKAQVALAASEADRAALERRVAELEGRSLPGGDSGRILQLIEPGKWQVHEIVERAAPLERRRVYSAVDRLIKIGFAVRHKYGTVEIFAARTLTPGASS